MLSITTAMNKFNNTKPVSIEKVTQKVIAYAGCPHSSVEPLQSVYIQSCIIPFQLSPVDALNKVVME